ncbi:hypothetical protein NLJ89_g11727 [Agrocybe chaxingu]|uniref:Uncharacterized protein n=1 Tax=Agrocybe chaxingu TaxID=84603 RepID=A0A9W8MPR3_9AGAR|nr:hypothetical protein NLJ89_g11727 [Agrocybe chaxingu]
MVIKRGTTTGLTVGRANNIFSYARIYDDDGDDKAKTSEEWAILPFDSESGAFSKKGDSGSVIVDGLGRIGDPNITYATPISFVLKRTEENGLHANVNPILTA